MAGSLLTPGTCRSCGCTTENACAGGCSWVDAERTLCSSCADGPSIDLDALRAAVTVGKVCEPLTISPDLALQLIDMAEAGTGALVEIPDADGGALVDPAAVVAICAYDNGDTMVHLAGGGTFVVDLKPRAVAAALGRRVRRASVPAEGSDGS